MGLVVFLSAPPQLHSTALLPIQTEPLSQLMSQLLLLQELSISVLRELLLMPPMLPLLLLPQLPMPPMLPQLLPPQLPMPPMLLPPLPLPVLSTLAQRELLPMLPMLLQLLLLPQLPMLLMLLSQPSLLLLQLTMVSWPTPMEPLSPLMNQLLLRLELLTSMLWLMPDTKFQSCQKPRHTINDQVVC